MRLEFEVGKPYPLPRPDNEGFRFETFSSGLLTGVAHLSNVTDAEIAAWAAPIAGLGFYNGPDYPCGVLMVILTLPNGGQWPFISPIAGSAQSILTWADCCLENNTLTLFLIEHETGILKAIRGVGLPLDLRKGLASCCRRNNYAFDPFLFAALQSKFQGSELWNRSAKWIFSTVSREFERR